MKRIAVFPGSFDPITLGHVDIIRRAEPLFDQVIVGLGTNTEKKYLFSESMREEWLRIAFSFSDKIQVKKYAGLTVDFCKQENAKFILRGIRSTSDLNFEMPIAQMNRGLQSDIETIFLLCSAELSAISSTIVRDVYKHGGDVRKFIPQGIILPKL